jgi:hypothetical protein
MRSVWLAAAIGVIALSNACAPTPSTQVLPSEMRVTSECVKKGNETFVKLYVSPLAGDDTWGITFTTETPEKLTIEKSSTHTCISWKIGKKHDGVLYMEPYEIKLSSSYRIYQATVRFQTTTTNIIGSFIGSLIRIR